MTVFFRLTLLQIKSRYKLHQNALGEWWPHTIPRTLPTWRIRRHTMNIEIIETTYLLNNEESQQLREFLASLFKVENLIDFRLGDPDRDFPQDPAYVAYITHLPLPNKEVKYKDWPTHSQLIELNKFLMRKCDSPYFTSGIRVWIDERTGRCNTRIKFHPSVVISGEGGTCYPHLF